jgi:homocysteine S-methyltransferase
MQHIVGLDGPGGKGRCDRNRPTDREPRHGLTPGSASHERGPAWHATQVIRPDRIGAYLAAHGVLVLDGGLATQLEAQGNDLSDRLWSARLLVEDPAQIVEAHLAYYRAGARVAITSSYQASFAGFARRGIGHDEAARLLRLSVTLAADARDRFRGQRREAGEPDPGPLFVAASVGPYGAALADGSEYRGRYGLTVDQLASFHRERLAVLADTDADLLAIETIPELEEAVALVGLLDDMPGSRAWVSFTCGSEHHIRSGAPIEDAVAAVERSPAVIAVGVNCTAPGYVEGLVRRISAVTAKPIVAYPNSGEGWNPIGRHWIGAPGPTVDRAAALRWIEAGASLVGGCCRVAPDQIAELAPLGS